MTGKQPQSPSRLSCLAAVAGRIAYLFLTGLAIVWAGGGRAFLNRRAGLPYLVLWTAWWTVTFLGRRQGSPTAYDQPQRLLVIISGMVSVPLLILLPSYEYARFSGPLPRDGLLSILGLILFAAGIALQAGAMWQIRGAFTVRLGVRPGQQLVQTGLYRLIRHPGYLSYIVSITGIAFAMGSVGTLALCILVVVFIRQRIRAEEVMLLAEFGQAYADYQSRTRRLLPFIY